MSKKYQIYKDINGKFRFRLRAENNKIVAIGEAYEQHASCIDGIKSIQMNCNAEIEDSTIEGAKILNPKYQVFYDEKSKFRFHLNSKNGEIIAQSQGYETKEGCLNGVNAVKNSCDAEIEDLTATQKPKEETICYDAIPEPKVPEAQPSAGPAQTVLELQKLTMVKKHEIVYFQGKLVRSDSGKGIPNAKIHIYERDRSLLGDDYLAYGNTAEDGSFSINWKARALAWFDNTGQIYAHFKGNEQAYPSKSAIQTITIN